MNAVPEISAPSEQGQKSQIELFLLLETLEHLLALRHESFG